MGPAVTAPDAHAQRADAQTHVTAGLAPAFDQRNKITFPSEDAGRSHKKSFCAALVDDGTVPGASMQLQGNTRAWAGTSAHHSTILKQVRCSARWYRRRKRCDMRWNSCSFPDRKAKADLLEALSGERRLQTKDSLKSLYGLLARVHGACVVTDHAVIKPCI